MSHKIEIILRYLNAFDIDSVVDKLRDFFKIEEATLKERVAMLTRSFDTEDADRSRIEVSARNAEAVPSRGQPPKLVKDWRVRNVNTMPFHSAPLEIQPLVVVV